MCKQLSDLGKIYMGGNATAPLLKAYMPYGQGSLWQQLTSNFLLANFVVNAVNI